MTEYKLKAFVARDACKGDKSDLYIGQNKPKLSGEFPFMVWVDFGEFMALPEELFPELKHTDEPIEVEVTIRKTETK